MGMRDKEAFTIGIGLGVLVQAQCKCRQYIVEVLKDMHFSRTFGGGVTLCRHVAILNNGCSFIFSLSKKLQHGFVAVEVVHSFVSSDLR